VSWPRAAGASAASLAMLLAASTGTAGARPAPTASVPPVVSVPLATSLQVPSGSWATVAMGHLGQPLNTFWQLLYEPKGASSWSDRVEATGVATNGGIVMAANATTFVVGVLPSNLLKYSPLIATANGGRSWSTGLVQGGLPHVPSALAEAPAGGAMALSRSQSAGPEVLYSHPGPSELQSWRAVATAKGLASSAGGASCDPAAITAVGYDRSTPVVGAACRRAGTAGVFLSRPGKPGGWALAGPALPRADGPAVVLGLVQTGGGLAALAEARNGRHEGLVAAWGTPSGPWGTSPLLPVNAGDQVASLGPASRGGVFVLLAGRRPLLEVAPGPGAPWQRLPAPPAGTQTVVFAAGAGPSVQALAVHESTLDVWDLARGAWRLGQVLHVPIEYGSSG